MKLKKIKETYIDYFLWIFPQKSISVENLCIKKWYLHGLQNSNLFITEMFLLHFTLKNVEHVTTTNDMFTWLMLYLWISQGAKYCFF